MSLKIYWTIHAWFTLFVMGMNELRLELLSRWFKARLARVAAR
jgi:hypothetical protein